MFHQYARAYYSQNTLSSCYCWDLGDKIEDGFAVAVVIKNLVDLAKEVDTGEWESNNVVHVKFEKENEKIKVVYKLTTSITLQMKFNHKVCGDVNLSGTVTRQIKFFNF